MLLNNNEARGVLKYRRWSHVSTYQNRYVRGGRARSVAWPCTPHRASYLQP